MVVGCEMECGGGGMAAEAAVTPDGVWQELTKKMEEAASLGLMRMAGLEPVTRWDGQLSAPAAVSSGYCLDRCPPAGCSSSYCLARKATPAAPVAPAAVTSSYCLAASEQKAAARGVLSQTSLGDLVMERYGGERGGRSHGFPGVREMAVPRAVGPGTMGRYRLSAELPGPASQLLFINSNPINSNPIN